MKYIKKPIVIEAVQWHCDIESEYELSLMGLVCPEFGTLTNHLTIKTLEGPVRASIGDYIIKGIKGEFYPCKPDIFEATYERASL